MRYHHNLRIRYVGVCIEYRVLQNKIIRNDCDSNL